MPLEPRDLRVWFRWKLIVIESVMIVERARDLVPAPAFSKIRCWLWIGVSVCD